MLELDQQQQQQSGQGDLKDLCSLQDCVLFIQQWKKQVDQVCKVHGGPEGRNHRSSVTTDLFGASDRSVFFFVAIQFKSMATK